MKRNVSSSKEVSAQNSKPVNNSILSDEELLHDAIVAKLE